MHWNTSDVVWVGYGPLQRKKECRGGVKYQRDGDFKEEGVYTLSDLRLIISHFSGQEIKVGETMFTSIRLLLERFCTVSIFFNLVQK